jgi:hypothetical protein
VDLELVRAIQRAQHGDVEQAAGFLRQPLAAPDGAPAVLGHELLQRHVEVVGGRKRLVDEFGADDRFANGEALIEEFLVHGDSFGLG